MIVLGDRKDLVTAFSRLKKAVSHINPPGRQSQEAACGLCGGSAGLITGRHTERQFVVPVGCSHLPYPVGEQPFVHLASDQAAETISAMIEAHRVGRRQDHTDAKRAEESRARRKRVGRLVPARATA